MITLALMAVLAAAPAEAACAPSTGGETPPCAEGRGVTVADLGWSSMECDCTQRLSNDWAQRRTQFRREPVLDEVRAGSGLRDGDVLVAVDGQRITSEEGGQRYAQIRPGQRVALTVRRDGRTQVVNVTAGARCVTAPAAPRPPSPPPARPPHPAPAASPPAPPTPPAAVSPAPPPAPRWTHDQTPPAPPAAPVAPTPRVPAAPAAPGVPAVPPPPAPAPPAPPAPPAVVLPAGWFGFGINCDDCGWAGTPRGRTPVWRFSAAPRVVNVETGSPAARAGMRRGDLLTHIDGVALTTADGGRRFGAVRPGQEVRWTYRRGDRSYTATTRAASRPDARTPAPRAEAQRLRYAGTVGGASVEVRGAPVTVTRDDRTGETVIRSGDITVRIRPDGRQRR